MCFLPYFMCTCTDAESILDCVCNLRKAVWLSIVMPVWAKKPAFPFYYPLPLHHSCLLFLSQLLIPSRFRQTLVVCVKKEFIIAPSRRCIRSGRVVLLLGVIAHWLHIDAVYNDPSSGCCLLSPVVHSRKLELHYEMNVSASFTTDHFYFLRSLFPVYYYQSVYSSLRWRKKKMDRKLWVVL